MITLIQNGGVVMWLILAGGLLALVVFLERLLYVHRAKIKAEDFIKGICNILGRRNITEALSICEETPGPVARIVRAAIQYRDQERRLIEQALDATALTEIARMERRLGVLAMVAQLAPLLGLFGTVLGMIRTFLALAQNAPLIQPGNLAGGVGQALLTTAAGLAVAMLAYAGYNLLVIKVDAIVLDMERSAGEIVGFFAAAPQNSKAIG